MSWRRAAAIGRVTAPGLIVALISAAAWADDAPPIPPDPELTDPALLRYGYQAGSNLQYRYELHSENRLSDLATSRAVEVEVDGQLRLNLAVQHVNDEGHAFVVEEVRDANLEVDAQGADVSERTLARALSGVARSLELSPRGAIVDEEVTTGELPPEMRRFSSDLGRLGDLIRLEFPATEVAVGESWRTDEQRPDARREDFDRRISWQHTLLGYASVNGRRCAVLRVTADTWIELPDENRRVGTLIGPALGRGVTTGYAYFDVVRGRLVRLDLRIGTVGQSTNRSTPLDFTALEQIVVELVD